MANQPVKTFSITNASATVAKLAGVAINALGDYFTAGVGQHLVGVSKFETPGGDAVSVEFGFVQVLLGGTVAIGDPILPTTATGVWTAADGDEEFYGIAVEAGVSGALVLAWVQPTSMASMAAGVDQAVFQLVNSVSLAELNAGKTLLAAVAGKTITVLDWAIVARGGAATAATAVTLSDTAGSPILIATVAVAGLTEDAVVKPSTLTHVTDGAAGIGRGLTADKGITVEKTGSDMTTATSFDVVIMYAVG